MSLDLATKRISRVSNDRGCVNDAGQSKCDRVPGRKNRGASFPHLLSAVVLMIGTTDDVAKAATSVPSGRLLREFDIITSDNFCEVPRIEIRAGSGAKNLKGMPRIFLEMTRPIVIAPIREEIALQIKERDNRCGEGYKKFLVVLDEGGLRLWEGKLPKGTYALANGIGKESQLYEEPAIVVPKARTGLEWLGHDDVRIFCGEDGELVVASSDQQTAVFSTEDRWPPLSFDGRVASSPLSFSPSGDKVAFVVSRRTTSRSSRPAEDLPQESTRTLYVANANGEAEAIQEWSAGAFSLTNKCLYLADGQRFTHIRRLHLVSNSWQTLSCSGTSFAVAENDSFVTTIERNGESHDDIPVRVYDVAHGDALLSAELSYRELTGCASVGDLIHPQMSNRGNYASVFAVLSEECVASTQSSTKRRSRHYVFDRRGMVMLQDELLSTEGFFVGETYFVAGAARGIAQSINANMLYNDRMSLRVYQISQEDN